ncbi:unnamed protein product [Bemisia tabaci]|uniref:Uncharacterized protein n=1 Tax=Bemisia tabaci TaxID=7038 RepID=A0A9P0ALI2_BEMTA|nr:unnamed protein product [Bemisia tabaci]
MAEETTSRTHPTGEDDAQIHQYLSAHKKPAHPDFVDYKKRLDSFKLWLPALNQTPEQMAASGFFYANFRDVVICFSCGIYLGAFERCDVPIIEHARHSKDCYFLQTDIGSECREKIY